jgi:hypothetical protein
MIMLKYQLWIKQELTGTWVMLGVYDTPKEATAYVNSKLKDAAFPRVERWYVFEVKEVAHGSEGG